MDIPGASAPALELSPANSGVPLLALPQASDAPDAQSAAQDAANASAAAVANPSDRLASLEGLSNQPKITTGDRREAILEREQLGLLDADSRAALVEALPAFASSTEEPSGAARQSVRDASIGQSTGVADEGAALVPGTSSEAAGSSLAPAEPGEQDSAASSSGTAPHRLGGTDGLPSRKGPLPDMRGASRAHSAQMILPKGIEMVGVPLSHEEAASTESSRQSNVDVPRRILAATESERPKFSLTVYAGRLPPYLRTSPEGG